jgi:predicted dehydrogenase
MKSLVVGLGFGQLYKDVLKRMGHQVVTVDSNPATKPDFTELTTALSSHDTFDTAHICVPNHLHYKTALKVAPQTKIVFVEKPGVESIDHWNLLVNLNKNTRFMMTKNNQWRDNIKEIADSCKASDLIQINWVNKNRIPGPGTWFTDKSKSFGGVSRDLLPHLMSIMISANPNNYNDFKNIKYRLEQKWNLSDCTGTEYGVVNQDGVYNVDDSAVMELTDGEKTYILYANWKSNLMDDVAVHFYKNGESHLKSIQLGLCPEQAYETMIRDCIIHKDDDDFWNKQLQQDLYIQGKINEDSTDIVH